LAYAHVSNVSLSILLTSLPLISHWSVTSHPTEAILRCHQLLCHSRKIPNILWYPKVHHRLHKIPPSVSILSEINKVRASLISLRCILILSPHLSLRLLIFLSLPVNPPPKPHITCFPPALPTQPSRLHHYNDTWRGEVQVHITQFQILTTQSIHCTALAITYPLISLDIQRILKCSK
jgi:hypothetical protein